MVTPVVDRPHETVRDGLGFGDHLGLAHLLLGHVEHRQQFPIPIAETVRDVAMFRCHGPSQNENGWMQPTIQVGCIQPYIERSTMARKQ